MGTNVRRRPVPAEIFRATASPRHHGCMRANLATAPAWIRTAFEGAFFAVWMSAWFLISSDGSWWKSVIIAVVIGLLYGLFMWWASRGQRRADAAILQGLTREQQREVVLAATTGASPGDPALQVRAAEMVRQRLIEHDRHPVAGVVVLVVVGAVSVLLAVTDDPWYFVGAAAACWLLFCAVREPRQMRRRIAALEPPRMMPPAQSAR